MKLNEKNLKELFEVDDYYYFYEDFKKLNIEKLQELIDKLNKDSDTITEYNFFYDELTEEEQNEKLTEEEQEELTDDYLYADFNFKKNIEKLESFLNSFNFLITFLFDDEYEVSINNFVEENYFIPKKVVDFFKFLDENEKRIRKLEIENFR